MCDEIKQIVINYFNSIPEFKPVTIEQLTTRTRKGEVVRARQVSIYFTRKFDKSMSLNKIAEAFYLRYEDHSTVLYSIQTVKNLCETDFRYRKYISDLELILNEAFCIDSYVI